jgi:hypothetical protein
VRIPAREHTVFSQTGTFRRGWLLPPEEAKYSFDSTDEAQHARGGGSVELGLLPAPDMPEMIAEDLSSELPDLLSQRVDECVHWEVSVICDPLTGSNPDAVRVIDAGRERMLEEDCDLTICMTDLPLRTNKLWPIVAAVSTARKTAVLSMPPLGVTLLRRRAREAMVQLVKELYEGSPELGQESEERDDQGMGTGTNAGDARHPGSRADPLIRRRLSEVVAPIRRDTPVEKDAEDIDVRFVSPTVRGHLRLLAGMVLANRPWRLFSTMKSALGAAFATGAYALVTPSVWQIGDSLGWVRLLVLMILALVAMVVWIIVAHNLWEKTAEREVRDQVALYNAATALTITVAVLFSYTVLFVLILVVASIFVPISFFQSILQHSVGPSDYMRLAWITASLATVAGALGSGVEDEETVREATYGYRQRRRNWPDDSEGRSDAH